MKLYDLQDELEDLQSQLTIIHETTNALEITWSGGELTVDQANWILYGIREKVEKSKEKAEELSKKMFETCKVLEAL